MTKKTVSTEKAPAAIGPYSQAVVAGNIVFTSGQIPIDPSSGEIVAGGIEAQARQVMNNIIEVLKAAGSDINSVVKTVLFIKDMNDFHVINRVYSEYFKEPYPARSCIQAARLPRDVGIEMEAVAIIDKHFKDT